MTTHPTPSIPKENEQGAHTPGPWVALEDGYIKDVNGKTVAFVPHLNMDNARLIASSPDLLEALWFVQKWMKMRSDKGEVFPSQLVNSVHGAIAKAKWGGNQ